MNEKQGTRIEGALVPMDSDAPGGMAVVVAPIGSVSRKDRERAARTSLERAGEDVVLHTSLPGRVTVQRRADGGSWEPVEEHRSARSGRTPLRLPAGTGVYRVLFSPKNENIPVWTSGTLAT